MTTDDSGNVAILHRFWGETELLRCYEIDPQGHIYATDLLYRKLRSGLEGRLYFLFKIRPTLFGISVFGMGTGDA